MTLRELKSRFIQSGINPAEAEVAACAVMNISRAQLFMLEEVGAAPKILKILKQRKKGKPLNLILKVQNFYGRDFFVSRHVLKPRQETEVLVREVLSFCTKSKNKCKQKLKVLDMCAGSGCIGLTVALESDTITQVTLAEKCRKAIKVCHKNAKLFNAKCIILRSNLFKKVNDKFDVIICNPPYIKTGDINNLQTEVKKYDPHLALDGGSDGLSFYRRIEHQLDKYLKKDGAAFLEIGFDQSCDVQKIFDKWKTQVIKDFDGNDRVATIIRKEKGR